MRKRVSFLAKVKGKKRRERVTFMAKVPKKRKHKKTMKYHDMKKYMRKSSHGKKKGSHKYR